MSPERAAEIAEEIGALKFGPNKPRAIMQLAKHLMEICHSDAEGDWLIDELMRMDEYPGPATLRDMVQHRFRPIQDANCFDGPAPVIACQRCGDWGHVAQEDGFQVRCVCAAGHSLPDNLLESLNRKHGARKPETKQELRPVIEMRMPLFSSVEDLRRRLGGEE